MFKSIVLRRALCAVSALVLFTTVACSSATPTPTAESLQVTEPTRGPVTFRSVTNAPNVTPPAVCQDAAAPQSYVKSVAVAKEVSAGNLEPIQVTDSYDPTQKKFHAVVKIENAPTSTRLKAAWYVVDASGYQGNSELDESEQVTGGTRNIDFTLSPTSEVWPTGSYCVQLFANGQLAYVKTFAVKGSVVMNSSPIVEVILAPQVALNNLAPIDPATSFAPTTPLIHCVVRIENAAAETKFTARWLLPDASVQEYTLTAQGSRRLDFTLTPGSSAFVPGEYKVEIYFNDRLDRVEKFFVQ